MSHTDPKREEEFVTLWLLTLDNGETYPLTSGLAKDMFPQWSPDGKQIAFLSTRGAKPQLYLISPDGGEARQLTDLAQGVAEGAVWSADGKQLAFATGQLREARDPNLPYRIDLPTYRFDGIGYIQDVLQDIYVISVDNGEIRQITDGRCMCSSPRWSPDGSHILYTVSMQPDTQRNILPGLRVVNVQSGSVSTIVGTEGWVISAAWLPDSKRIAYIGCPACKKLGFATKDDLWVTTFDDEGVGAAEARTTGLKYSIGSRLQPDIPVWHLLNTPILMTDDGEEAYVNVQIGGTLHIYRVALSGPEQWQPIVGGNRAAILIDAHGHKNNLLYVVSMLNSPTELFTFAVDTGGEQKLTSINDAVLELFAQPEIQNLRFTTPENVELEAWIMKPPIGQPPYPTVLYIHGGPYGSFGEIFNFDFQILAGAGYAVLFPNFRGSAGYGADFLKSIVGNWGDIGYADNMATVDYVISQGQADPDRLGICGYSHGGFATCWTVGHTHRFKAAVAENPITNWISAYGMSDAATSWMSEEFGGHPHEMPDVYLKKSPIMYAHNCTTPTLLVVGELDFRCPVGESEQFYTILKAHGCTVEMLRLPNSTHIGTFIGPTVARRAQNEALVDWFNRFLA